MGLLKSIKTGCKISYFATRVAGGIAVSSLKGIKNALDIANESLDKINKKDWEGLEKELDKRGKQICDALDYKIDSLCKFSNAIEHAITERDVDSLVSKENTKLAVVALGTGLAAIGVSSGVDIINDDLDDETSTESIGFVGSEAVPIENGVFVGDNEELVNLIKAGEIDGTVHLDAEEVDRDLSIRDTFLQNHGYSEVPEGYEVHHVIPLCEGGIDSASNMVLVSIEQHDIITAEHAKFYGWRDK